MTRSSRVFLSYGHDSRIALARRLKTDLEAAGYAVWFDEERLLTGKDWETYIEDGLDWTASGSGASAFLLLMTPHSVRRPGGFCLNELARALSRGSLIYPIMVQECEPPLSIARLQWLDMQGCLPLDQNQERYQKALAQLLAALDAGQVEPTGTWAWLRKHLEPISFEAEMKLHSAHFVGRRQLLNRIQTWLADPNGSGIVWITADPGVGKTALAVQLCQSSSQVLAFHFCRFGDSLKNDARRCILSLAYQLATQLPEYASCLEALDLSRISSLDNPVSIFDALFAQPLSRLDRTPEQTSCIVIDALDEAKIDGGNPLSELVAVGAARMPAWLRLLVTSRPEAEVIFHLQEYDPHVLDAGSTENTRDLHEYLVRHLASLTEQGEGIDSAISQISEKSEGSFLYARLVADDLLANRIELDQIPDLPRGLGGVFAQFLSRQFRDIQFYDDRCRPVLELIVAARRLPSLPQVAQ